MMIELASFTIVCLQLCMIEKVTHMRTQGDMRTALGQAPGVRRFRVVSVVPDTAVAA